MSQNGKWWMAIYQYSNWFLIPGEMGGSDCSTAGRKPPLGKCWFRWTSHLCSDRFTPSGQWSVLTAGRTCHKIQLWQLNGLQGEPCISVPNSSDELIFVKSEILVFWNSTLVFWNSSFQPLFFEIQLYLDNLARFALVARKIMLSSGVGVE